MSKIKLNISPEDMEDKVLKFNTNYKRLIRDYGFKAEHEGETYYGFRIDKHTLLTIDKYCRIAVVPIGNKKLNLRKITKIIAEYMEAGIFYLDTDEFVFGEEYENKFEMDEDFTVPMKL